MRRHACLALSCLSVALGCGEHPSAASDSGLPKDSAAPDGTTDAAPPSDSGTTFCDPAATWGNNQLVAASTAQSDLLGAVTGDELTIAWMTAQGTVMYADRQSATSPFGAPQTLSGAIALDEVALSGDGLTLIVVLQDRSALAQTTRASRSAAFSSTLDAAPFAQLDPQPTETDASASQGLFADPVLSSDGQMLYYSQYGVSTYTMHESYGPSAGVWPQGRSLVEKSFVAASLSARMRPTGLSADQRALFYWDEAANIERVAFRDGVQPTNDTYTTFADVGAYQYAVPTSSCARLYFSASGSGGLDLYYADKQ
ncbi:MAG TPA: hypothetical protein VLM85_33190 [Polyangiaceae bacterium]|nr:hypothetical protein [Polyangiaceae bacterium]